MPSFIYSILIILFSLPSPQPTQYNLTVIVKGASSDKGQMLIALFDKENSYPKNASLGAKVKIKNKQATYTFKNLSKGTYAVSTFHDANSNEKIDVNSIGIPKEDYGFSNNPNSMFGPPSYSKASFPLTGDKTITIYLN